MKNRNLLSIFTAALLALSCNYLITEKWEPQLSNFTNTAHFSAAAKTPTHKKNTIQVALLLDTSGSMSGLIEQAKSQLWQILNTLANTEKENEDTKLEIALYQYGSPTYGKRARQIKQLSGFTTDMDLISKKLFALGTSGGEEYCGEVITTSISELEWGKDDSNFKMIYIAGNEPFTQGPINYAQACQLAKKQDITVNTIFCGTYQEGVQTMWKQGAQLTDGEYMNIDHNQTTVYIETPYDKKINELNQKLNETYIPYGTEGKRKKENQTKQDYNASSYSSANAADRAYFKSSKKYKAESWDLVDAYKDSEKITGTIERTTLPDSLQTLTVEELEVKIKTISVQRTNIQNEIQSLNSKRLIHIENNSKESAVGNNLKKSIENSVEKQGKKKGYKIKN
ncbi:MAG: VWA domain-containing protein [Saprospiraceae bacterium]